jgi:hypothetical protein
VRIFTPQTSAGRQILEVSALAPAGRYEKATGAITSGFDKEMIKWTLKILFLRPKPFG